MRQHTSSIHSKDYLKREFSEKKIKQLNKKLARKSASFYEDYKRAVYPERNDHLHFIAKNISY